MVQCEALLSYVPDTIRNRRSSVSVLMPERGASITQSDELAKVGSRRLSHAAEDICPEHACGRPKAGPVAFAGAPAYGAASRCRTGRWASGSLAAEEDGAVAFEVGVGVQDGVQVDGVDVPLDAVEGGVVGAEDVDGVPGP